MKWIKYTLKTTTAACDLVIDMMTDAGVDGVLIEDNVPISEADKKRMFIDFLPVLPIDEGVSYLSFYLEDDSDEERLLAEIRTGLEELKDFVDVGEGTVTKSETEDKDWINNWKEFFKSFTVDNIVIKPTWEEMKPEYEGKLLIQIDPGIAFGTGMHETTQLCMRQLLKYVNADTKILDVGCGSGILSIVALKLGAAKAVGVDIDENATIATNENLEVNNIPSDKCKVYTGNILEDESLCEKLGYEQYDIVVANILADVLLPLTPIVPNHLKKGGLFITSGIIDTKEEEVKQAVLDNGSFEILDITRQKDWSSITARRI
ncbi:MAG: 50S ribosomal protein L11 methyltransferase [Lachnospiraceae bacterium]|nr:50S ribosomal protein L11 methyltransferase [Lachnospiraceae bacterium]MDE6697884.1 50S ribosomal protein L11 methyltransferase [Lachnospiraceae bacterium]